MEWIDALSNPQRVLAIYGAEPPTLESVHIHEVCLDRNGPTLKIRLDLSTVPARMPEKWRRDGLNVVQIQIIFGGLEKIELGRFSVEPMCDMEIRRRGAEVYFSAESDSVGLLGVAKTATVVHVSAYMI